MNIHEYQGKEILSSFGVAIQQGIVATTADEAVTAAKELQAQTGTGWWVIKAQIHAGGRGKGGGVKLAKNIDEVKEALHHNFIHRIMLDNFSDESIRAAVNLVKEQGESPLIEVSGGVTKDRLRAIREAGADAVSVGALTTQAPNVDISMRIVAEVHG